MIKSERESPVTCGTCGKPALRRQVDVLNTHGGRPVVYDTHANSLHHESHSAALGRIDQFHERMHKLQFQLRGALEKNPPTGFRVVICEIDAIRPTACEVRSLIVPNMEIQAFGHRSLVSLDARPMKGQSAAKILAELKRAAVPVVVTLKAQHDSGEY